MSRQRSQGKIEWQVNTAMVMDGYVLWAKYGMDELWAIVLMDDPNTTCNHHSSILHGYAWIILQSIVSSGLSWLVMDDRSRMVKNGQDWSRKPCLQAVQHSQCNTYNLRYRLNQGIKRQKLRSLKLVMFARPCPMRTLSSKAGTGCGAASCRSLWYPGYGDMAMGQY